MSQKVNCVFCQIVEKKKDAYIVYEDDFCIAFLDAYPQTRGHLQLIPKKHYRWVYEVPEMGKLFTTAQRLIRVIIPALGADHVTLATLGHQIEHAHIWIVPQYKMETTLGEWGRTKGQKQDLQAVSVLLKRAIGEEVLNAQ